MPGELRRSEWEEAFTSLLAGHPSPQMYTRRPEVSLGQRSVLPSGQKWEAQEQWVNAIALPLHCHPITSVQRQIASGYLTILATDRSASLKIAFKSNFPLREPF